MRTSTRPTLGLRPPRGNPLAATPPGPAGSALDPAEVERLLADGAMTVQQGVQFSAIGRSALYAAMSRGDLRWLKVGKRRLIPRKALVAFLAAGLRGGWSPEKPDQGNSHDGQGVRGGREDGAADGRGTGR